MPRESYDSDWSYHPSEDIIYADCNCKLCTAKETAYQMRQNIAFTYYIRLYMKKIGQFL